MNIRRKITHTRLHPLIQRTPVRQMPTQTHPRGPNLPIARRQRQQIIHRQRRVLVVRRQLLGDFPFVAVVRVFGVIGEGFGAGEFVVG